jgi:NAD(P)-dependent dehydrogenase (short-subunit alcohol dehydrogenase family)
MSKSQKVLVTGSSRGMGLAITRTLLDQGYTVFATMRNIAGRNVEQAKALQTFAENKEGTLHLLELDVSRDESVEAAVQTAIELEGRIDVVVNNAGEGYGYGVGAYGETASMEQFQHIFDVNVFGVQRLVRAVLPAMRQQGSGLLIMISSTMGRIVLPFAAPYTATKYAVEGLSESYHYELSTAGIDVVIIEPGGFKTDFWSEAEPPADAGRVQSYGSLAERPQKMYEGITTALHQENAPDPKVVAEAVLRVIETPAGQRPLRLVVDPMMGGEAPRTINQLTDQIQTQLLTSLGLADLLTR